MLKRADPKNQPRTALDSYSRHMSRLTLSLTLNARKVNEKLSVSKTNFSTFVDHLSFFSANTLYGAWAAHTIYIKIFRN